MHRRTTDTAASSRPCRTNASREARSIWAGGNSHSHRHPTQIPAAVLVLEAPVQVQATDAQVAEGGAGSVSSAGEVSPDADRANLLPMPAPAG